MERKHGHLDGKGEEEAPEQNPLQGGGKLRNRGQQRGNVKRVSGARPGQFMRAIVKRQNGQQHQYRSGQRVEEKFDRSIEPPVAAPHADQKVHRDEHHFPEQVEEEEIERHEDAQHARLQQQKQNVVFLLAGLNRAPRRKNGNRAQNRGQHDQKEADTVDSQ